MSGPDTAFGAFMAEISWRLDEWIEQCSVEGEGIDIPISLTLHESTTAPNTNIQRRPHVLNRSTYVKRIKLVEAAHKR